MTLISDPQPSGAFAWTQAPFGRVLTCAGLPARHAFTSRDVQLRDDEQEWTAVASFVGVPLDRLLLVRQVHGTGIAVARRSSSCIWPRPEADIVISDDPDVAVCVRVADCAPILILDSSNGAVAAVHAGWRGAAKGAVAKAVHAMATTFGSRPSDLIAAIGPCLGRCCGEVGPDVVQAFRAGGAGDASIGRWFSPGTGDRFQLDLAAANHEQLTMCGVDPRKLFVAGLCTRTWAGDLHSYRATGADAGRMAAVIRAVGI